MIFNEKVSVFIVLEKVHVITSMSTSDSSTSELSDQSGSDSVPKIANEARPKLEPSGAAPPKPQSADVNERPFKAPKPSATKPSRPPEADVEPSGHSEPKLQLSWTNRKPTFRRTVGALFKKNWLLKVRRPAAIVEFILACVIIFPLQPIYEIAQTQRDGFLMPELVYADEEFSNPNRSDGLIGGMALYADSKFILLPDTALQRTLIAPGFEFIWQIMANLPEPYRRSFSTKYMNTLKDMEDLIYSSDATGIGIHWPVSSTQDCNVTELGEQLLLMQKGSTEEKILMLTEKIKNMTEALINPKITIYEQSLMTLMGAGSLSDILFIMRLAIVTALASLPDSMNQWQHQGLAMNNTRWALQTYATVSTTQFFEIHIAVVFFAILPVILSVMPDFQTVLEEKDSKVAAYTFLMGCPETAYWLVNFLMPFLLSVPPYLLWSIIITQWFGMKGTDLTLMLVICLLFVIGHIWFILFLSTFMKKGSAGRSVTILLLVLTMFFAFLHQYFTLDENISSTAVKHIFSIVPLSAFELVMMSMYTEAMNSRPPFGWGDIGRDIVYPPYYGLLWLFLDCIIYFLLFLLFNMTMPRQFGTPPLGWKRLLSIDAWKRMFREDNNFVGALSLKDKEDFLQVKGISKVYHAGRDVQALDNIDFTIQTGEVIVVIGPNGAGKSTMINVIAGAIEPSSGTMQLLGGEEMNRFKDIQRYLGIVFQENVIINLLSVREHMYLFGAFRGIPLDVLEESIDFYAHTLQLTHMLANRAGDLSGGQKRKLCISLSLLGNPPIVIMDEPTAGVDVQARQLIWKTIASLDKTTSLITSHALEEAEAVSSRLFIVSQGRLPFCGTSTELRNKYQCGYLLRVQGSDSSVHQVLELAQSHVPTARITEDRQDTIAMPVDAAVPVFLTHLQEKLEEYGVVSYAFAVEQLEDMLLKLIQTDEAAYQGK
jgi:ABC-type multidrug transport system ATPase subunit